MAAYPYDEVTRARVARLLYQAFPVFYRVQDQPPLGTQELEKFTQVLAAPLATLRQSVDELHANLFIDTCGDAALKLLAEIVGTDLLFPDADTNRRDVRGTVSRRQRKGTRPELEELGRELTEHLTVLLEGWQRLAMVQDINVVRPERVISNVRPATFGTSATGPLDAAHHFVDFRKISARTGRYHQRHVTHWVSITRMFPLTDGTPSYFGGGVPDPLDPQAASVRREWRYAFHALGQEWALRQRATNDDDLVRTDRILGEHFAARPGDFFGKDGRFVIRVAGLPAAVADPNPEVRDAIRVLADREIVTSDTPGASGPTIVLLERPLHNWQNGLFLLALCDVDPDGTQFPSGNVDVRATLELGTSTQSSDTGALENDDGVVLLRLTATGGADGGYFPGATVAITGGRPEAGLAHPNSGIASQGFLRGALAVTLPPTWVIGERWFYLTADGSVFDAQVDPGNSDPPNVSFFVDALGVRTADPAFERQIGRGAAWPPLPREAEPEKLTAFPPTPGRGASILHGARVISTAVTPTTESSLVFAMRYFDQQFIHEPVGRLVWFGSDPRNAEWQLLDRVDPPFTDPPPVVSAPAAIDALMRELVAFRNEGPNSLVLAMRFESEEPTAIFTPSEVVWSSDDGDAVLLYLPELTTNLSPTGAVWPTAAANVSEIVQADQLGSTRTTGGSLRRVGEGQVAPLRGPVLHTRRRVKWREIPAGTPAVPSAEALARAERCLDVDVEHGRFSFYGEAPQAWPDGPIDTQPVPRPPNVTVAFEDAYTGHVGARPSAREILIFQLTPTPSALLAPTRLVSRSGTVSASHDADLYVPPRYTSLNAALAAVQAAPTPEEADPDGPGAIIQIDDDATYPGEALIWPTTVHRLTILAADARRPTVRFTSAAAPPLAPFHYDSLMLRGVAFGGATIPLVIALPSSDRVDIQFCTVTDTTQLDITLEPDGVCSVLRSITGGLRVTNPGILEIKDSVIDSGKLVVPTTAIDCVFATAVVERSTVIGLTNVFILEASHCIFDELVTVADRFHGCIRFSTVPFVAEGVSPTNVLPHRHEVTEIETPRFLSLSRHNPAHVRPSEVSPRAVRQGGEDGSELGAFGHVQMAQRLGALERRLGESTPAGLVWALLRVD